MSAAIHPCVQCRRKKAIGMTPALGYKYDDKVLYRDREKVRPELHDDGVPVAVTYFTEWWLCNDCKVKTTEVRREA